MGTSTVTQAREPQKVGESYNLNRTKKPRNCVKTQMMQRDCAKKTVFQFLHYSLGISKCFGQRQILIFTAGVPPDSEGKVRCRKMGREALCLYAILWHRDGN